MTCKNFHRSATVAVNAGKCVITFKDAPTGIVDKSRFCFAICQAIPDDAMALPVMLVINGAQVPLWDKYGDVATASELKTRCSIKGWYGVQTTGTGSDVVTSPHVISDIPVSNRCAGSCW